jgi:hypothetical protein
MELVLDHPHLVDSLRFRLEATRSAHQAEVRITVAVVALVSAAERDPKALDSRVLAALKELIPAPWSFSHVVREADAAGFERIKLRAAARVPQSENWNLAERARKVSREGLSIAVADVSYAMSREQLRQIVTELRLELLRDAAAQAKSMSEASGRHWRVGDIEFGVPDYGSDRPQYTGKGASRDPDGIGELLAELGEGSGLTSGERVAMNAAVTLKADTGWRDRVD